MRTLARTRCRICGKAISVAGFAKASHMRKHVRQGEAVERHYKLGKHECTIYEPTGERKDGIL